MMTMALHVQERRTLELMVIITIIVVVVVI